MSFAIVPYVHSAQHFKPQLKETEMNTSVKDSLKMSVLAFAFALIGAIAMLFAVNGLPTVNGISVDLNPKLTQEQQQVVALQDKLEMKQRVVDMIAKERAEMVTIAATLRVAYNAELQKGCIAKIIESTKPQQAYVKSVGETIAVQAQHVKEYVSGLFTK